MQEDNFDIGSKAIKKPAAGDDIASAYGSCESISTDLDDIDVISIESSSPSHESLFTEELSAIDHALCEAAEPKSLSLDTRSDGSDGRSTSLSRTASCQSETDAEQMSESGLACTTAKLDARNLGLLSENGTRCVSLDIECKVIFKCLDEASSVSDGQCAHHEQSCPADVTMLSHMFEASIVSRVCESCGCRYHVNLIADADEDDEDDEVSSVDSGPCGPPQHRLTNHDVGYDVKDSLFTYRGAAILAQVRRSYARLDSDLRDSVDDSVSLGRYSL
eukprot:TRINITY_DN27085_c0_g1_i1.p1 TRINITY_DN27085_c0_g1~~TRINITY_DN27085_c0_g1_i1.p1  ORF type:complete len:276 (-),score=43.93 TRINITY_DN27085_c0_g1_i1:434-1261(-)